MSTPRSGLVAVLFTDLVGSTELMTHLGDKAFDDLRRRHFAALAKAVAAHGGEEVKNTGDGLMAVFASAAEAVEAAVAMQQATARQAKGSPLAIRVGVAVGDATFEDGDYFGTPVVEAARLVAAARPGQILTTQIARALAGTRCSAMFVDLAPLELKGLPDPVAVCEVGWQPAGSSVPIPALLTDIGRIFVGRDAELERLGQLWKEAVVGERRVALLAGEPGVGKTRLTAEVAMRVHDEGGVVLAGRCDEDLGVPYQPFVEALRHFVDHAPVDDLLEHLGRYGGELARLLPELTERLPDLPSPLKSDPETERYRLFDAVAAWLAAVSAENPFLLVFDDLQWAAKPTLLLLRHVVRSGDVKRVLVLGTYRDTEVRHDHPIVEVLGDVRRQGGVERISLGGLNSQGVAAFMEQAAGRALDEKDRGLATAIHEETEGNPFFVREVLRHLMESEAIDRRSGHWATGFAIEDLGIPDGVREVVGKRLTRLSDVANQVLRTAAVIGTEFEPDLIGTAGDFDEDDLIAALEEAAAARLVLEAPGGRYRFAHALVRDTVYGGLSAVRRAALHRRVAEGLERLVGTGPGPRVSELARHWSAAGLTADSTAPIDYARWAGQEAIARLAFEDAVRWFVQALELLDARRSPDEQLRAMLLVEAGSAQRLAGDPAHRETLLEAGHLAARLGDTQSLVAAALANNRGFMSQVGAVDDERVALLEAALAATSGDRPERAQLMAILAVELTHAGDWSRRRALISEAVAMARRLDDRPSLVRVLNVTHFASLLPETLQERLAHSAEVVELTAGQDDPTVRHFAHRIALYSCMEAGDLAGVDAHLPEVVQTATATGDPGNRWAVAFIRSVRAVLAGRLDEAETSTGEALQIGTDIGAPEASAVFAVQILEIRRQQDRLGELEPIFRQAAAEHPGIPSLRAQWAELCCDTGDHATALDLLASVAPGYCADYDYGGIGWAYAAATLAEVCSLVGNVEWASRLYGRLLPWHQQVTFVAGVVTRGAVAHYLAVLAALLDRDDTAEGHFTDALNIHQRLQSPFWTARTRLEWARMLLSRRRAADAPRTRELLEEALATGREAGLAAIERPATALLGELP